MKACTNVACDAKASFIYTGKWVKRNAAIIQSAMMVYCIVTIPLARCTQCGRGARVLPVELFPRKIYGIQVIEAALRLYMFSVGGLRKAVDKVPTTGDRQLWHTTLHRWSIGLGEKLLDRHDEVLLWYPPTTAALLSEAGKKLGCYLRDLFMAARPCIAPAKYRTERRREQLEAIGRLLTVAARVYAEGSLMAWALQAIPSFNVAVWNFPCFYSVTFLRHTQPP